ncbi:hypothetical protein [Paraclostridium bifermentans]|uniref:hypothetical protein n=1 Tax=Paraclostridium bifermentans TaxID=1490 RepID=UPI0018A09A6F|nr:hypothetical protein [Paraclostridium bifermentans]
MAFIKPEVFTDIVTEKIKGKVVVSNLADDLGVLSGDVGDTVSFPIFEAIGEAKELTKGQGIDEAELSQVDSKAKIKQVAAPGVVVYDIESKTALGNQVENAASQQATSIARKIDADLIEECKKTTLKVATAQANSITEDELHQGFTLFGDEQDNDEIAGIVINSILAPSFYHMDGFVNANITHVADGNGVVRNGIIGYFRGTIPVCISDKATLDSSECITFIIKKHALAKMFKSEKVADCEVERQAKYKRTAIYTDSIYAVKMVNTEGVVMLRKTIA